MLLLRTHHLLRLLVALLFALGYAHQIFGRYELHHHGAVIVGHLDDAAAAEHDHEDEEHDHHDDNEQRNADHMCEHASLAAVLPALIVPMVVAQDSVALVVVSAGEVPEAPVAGIDHPPQLIR